MPLSASLPDFVVAIDQGTTATKVHRLDANGEFVTLDVLPHQQIFPRPGWVEHDAVELLASVQKGAQYAVGAAGIGIDNQGETVIAWDSDTGEPICNAIVWQDNRTANAIARLRAAGAEELTLARAGLPLDPYFSASKLRWIIDNVDAASRLMGTGRLRMGTSDSYFLDRLCGRFVTDATTASRTSLMNLRTLEWDPELCRLFDIPVEVLPAIVPTTGEFGASAATGGACVMASIVDQQAALYGHGCRGPGAAKITFGTGAFALCVAGHRVVSDPGSGLLPTLAWQIRGQQPVYAVDGGVYNAGSAVDWLRQLGLYAGYDEIDAFDGASAVERGLVFVPALSGLACPYWDRSASGMWLGLGLDTRRADLCRAVLEGVALRTAQVLRAMRRHVPMQDAISIDGGLSRNAYFCEFLAAALGCQVTVSANADVTGYGTALLAAAAAGMEVAQRIPAQAERRFHVGPLPEHLHHRYADAIERCRAWRQEPKST
jgi:glycerol kinase